MDIVLRVVDIGVKDYTMGDMQNVAHSTDKTFNGANNYCNRNVITREEVERYYNIRCKNMQKCNTKVILFSKVGIDNMITLLILLCF